MEEPFGPSDTLDVLPFLEGAGYVLVARESGGGQSSLVEVLQGHPTVVVTGASSVAAALTVHTGAYLVLLELAGPLGVDWPERVDRLIDTAATTVPVWVVATVGGAPPPTAPLSRWFPKPIALENVAALAEDLRRRARG